MRLIILFLMLSVAAFGQEGTITPVTIGTADAGAGDNLYDAFTKVNANDNILNTSVSTLNTNTTGVSGWTISINATDDSLVFTLGNNVYKVPIGDTEEDDITPPTVTAIEVGTLSSDTVVVTFSEVMDTPVPTTGVTLSEDGDNYGLGTWFFSSTTQLKIPLDSTAETGKSYLLSYVRPGASDFQDVAGNKLASFSSEQVVNNITASSAIYAYMLFEDNDDDEMGVMTFTWGGTELYKTTDSPPEGTHSTNTSGGGVMTTNESHDLGDSWSFSGWFSSGNESDANPRYLLALDGADIWYDYTDGASYLEGTIGGGSFQSTLQSDATAEYKWTHMAVTYDGVSGYARTYINGGNVSNDSIVGVGADSNGDIYIGWTGGATAYKLYGDFDDVQFYKNAVLTDVQIDSVYTYPGVPVGGKTDPPIPTDDINILWEEDWSDFSVTALHTATSPAGIDNDDLAAHYTNFESLGSDSWNDPTKADNVDIVLFDGSNALKSWYPEGQCCTGAYEDIVWGSNGGTGVDLYAYINSDQSTETEVYVSWNQWIYADFENSWGYKGPGIINSKSSGHSTSRLITNDNSGYEFNIGHYTYAYYDSYATTRNATQRYDENYELGKWVNVTVRSYTGTAGNSNGLVEMFIDGILIGGFYSKPYLDTGDDAWKIYNMTTFMGGLGTEYYSPIDQWIIYGENVIFNYDSGADVVRGSTPSSSGRDISGTLESISSLNFPR